jgi:hypothetical protein
MVRPERFERPTYWFVASCSIQLSYGRTLRGVQLFKFIGDCGLGQPLSSRMLGGGKGTRLRLVGVSDPGVLPGDGDGLEGSSEPGDCAVAVAEFCGLVLCKWD